MVGEDHRLDAGPAPGARERVQGREQRAELREPEVPSGPGRGCETRGANSPTSRRRCTNRNRARGRSKPPHSRASVVWVGTFAWGRHPPPRGKSAVSVNEAPRDGARRLPSRRRVKLPTPAAAAAAFRSAAAFSALSSAAACASRTRAALSSAETGRTCRARTSRRVLPSLYRGDPRPRPPAKPKPAGRAAEAEAAANRRAGTIEAEPSDRPPRGRSRRPRPPRARRASSRPSAAASTRRRRPRARRRASGVAAAAVAGVALVSARRFLAPPSPVGSSSATLSSGLSAVGTAPRPGRGELRRQERGGHHHRRREGRRESASPRRRDPRRNPRRVSRRSRRRGRARRRRGTAAVREPGRRVRVRARAARANSPGDPLGAPERRGGVAVRGRRRRRTGASPGAPRRRRERSGGWWPFFSVVVVGGGERLLAQGRPALGVGLARHPREVALARGLLGGARARRSFSKPKPRAGAPPAREAAHREVTVSFPGRALGPRRGRAREVRVALGRVRGGGALRVPRGGAGLRLRRRGSAPRKGEGGGAREHRPSTRIGGGCRNVREARRGRRPTRRSEARAEARRGAARAAWGGAEGMRRGPSRRGAFGARRMRGACARARSAPSRAGRRGQGEVRHGPPNETN